MKIGYCTNVHAGADLTTTRENLERYALAVKRSFSPSAPMGIGLWISAAAAQQLADARLLSDFSNWLSDAGLLPFTLNGFPYGDFHDTVVKHKVYEPTWADPRRADYTIGLARILDQLLPSNQLGSISTLPLGWNTCRSEDHFLDQCGEQLRRVAGELIRLHETTGREVVIGLEPEPGCAFDTAKGAAEFFDRYIVGSNAAQTEALRKHLGICHDICHSAVMREPQSEAFAIYAQHGLRVAKVQVSSALSLKLTGHPTRDQEAIQTLRGFAEDRYLHQTTVASSGGEVRFYEDLKQAIDDWRPGGGQEWRIHFHVPIHEARLGWIDSTRSEIDACLDAIALHQTAVDHFEVETYAWSVLPPEHRISSLSDGIAAELAYFDRLANSHGRVGNENS